MKLALINKKKDKISFEILDSSAAYVNTLRRKLMKEVPTMAISTVEFKQNTSAVYDEMIAHRLGLLALKTDLKTYNIPEAGADESAATHVKFTLKGVGPKTIYAGDLKSKDSKIVPVFPETPIVKLLDNQELEFVATGHLGKGIEHSKWNTGLISFYYKPHIKVNNKSSKLKESLEKFPPQVVKKDQIVEEKISSAPELIDACTDIENDVVKITYDNPHKDFVFSIESWGQLTPSQIVEAGIEEFNTDLIEFEKALKTM